MLGSRSLLFCTLCICLFTPSVFAQEPEEKLEALIDKVTATYGGEALLSLRNYEIIESYVSPNAGQSWHPALTDIGGFNFRLVHDLESGHMYQESWFVSPSGRFPNINVINGDGAWSINLPGERYGEAANADPYAIAGGIIRTTDTLLARELINSREEAEYLGSAIWRNSAHERVKIPFPLSADVILYVNSESGLITRMNRDNPQIGLLDYVFDEHRMVDGLMAAQSVNFSIAGDPNLVGTGRDIRFNQSLSADTFDVPEGLSAEGERFDDSEMIVNRLSSEVYHVGQNGAYSLFVDTGDELVVVGAYAGLTERVAQFREATDNHRPIAYQVVTHHHSDHISGVDEALALGATLVTVDNTESVLRDSSALASDDTRMLLVDGRMTLGSKNQEVHIYDVSTTHSASNLLFYVPSTRTLFLADHFGGPFATGIPDANGNAVSMAAALEPLDMGFKRIVTAHNGRVYTDREFAAAVAAYEPFTCPADRPLCSR